MALTSRLGPRKPLGVEGLEYRAKGWLDGWRVVMVRVYAGRALVGGTVGVFRRLPRRSRIACIHDIWMLERELPVLLDLALVVDQSHLAEEYRGRGVGTAMYQALFAAGLEDTDGEPFYAMSMACWLGTGTSSAAHRVWRALSRHYLSEGGVVVVGFEANDK